MQGQFLSCKYVHCALKAKKVVRRKQICWNEDVFDLPCPVMNLLLFFQSEKSFGFAVVIAGLSNCQSEGTCAADRQISVNELYTEHMDLVLR